MGGRNAARIRRLFLGVIAFVGMLMLRLGVPRCSAWSLPRRIQHHSRLFSVASDWKGPSHSTSDFVTHVVVRDDSPTVASAIASALPRTQNSESDDNFNTQMNDIPLNKASLNPHHYLQLGSVWFLPADAPRDPAQGQKPIRLSLSFHDSTLSEGDYLRIHHSPRRFPLVYKYNWTAYKQTGARDDESKPGVVVARNHEKGYWVIDKPAHIPVHPTVDNVLENIASMIRQALGGSDAYATTPQRLDQNTSGLFVVATSKMFASFFAKLLRRKTDQQLSNSTVSDAIHKRYKCLLCLIAPQDDDAWSVATAMNRLHEYANEQRLMRHYLEPSIRAPKRFVDTQVNDTWAECLLRITSVGEPCPLVGSVAGKELAGALWNGNDAIPSKCVAVVEVEVELLTGRTHQIRGQLATEGFPLVGDAQYGGAVPQEAEGILNSTHYIHSEELALQCSQLEFLDPDIVVTNDGTELMVPSDRWNTFRLDECWWTPLLQKYRVEAAAAGDTTTNVDDLEKAMRISNDESGETRGEEQSTLNDDLLPPKVRLSPGAHKYVLVKATHPTQDIERWFVKSAAPSECGGPYHANVAQDLVEWLEAAGYEAVVTGGGRIDYNSETKQACVFGFSYGFGKGNHAQAALLISEWSKGSITATHDDSDALY